MLAFFWNGLVMPQAFTLGAIGEEGEVDHCVTLKNFSTRRRRLTVASQIASKQMTETMEARRMFIIHQLKNRRRQ
jgi:hypothetical protein